MNKELNIYEALQMEQGDEFTVIHSDGSVNEHKAILEIVSDHKVLMWDTNNYLLLSDRNINSKFILVSKPVSFIEAVRSGKSIRVDVSDFDNILPEEEREKLNTYAELDNILRTLSTKFYNGTIRKIITLGKWYIKHD